MDKVTVISPLYKSEKYVTELYQRISQTLNDLDLEYEIIFVDDCYGDRSLENSKKKI